MVADKAPGRLINGSPEMDLARTHANAEFCIPVSIDTVRLVLSSHLKAYRGMMNPAAKPIQCNKNTESNATLRKDSPTVIAMEAAFCATTPPQINETSSTLANGVNLDIH
mmetsp:Transcript_18674/g.26466  ORF Transcript_18674/g.26466 Transcript_18674/m.26466 type:complete len:110 (-) Transcript_18674:153-482(-)